MFSKKFSRNETVLWLHSDSTNEVIGFNAGFHFAMEHEKGMSDLIRSLSGSLQADGKTKIEDRTISNMDNIKVLLNKDKGVLILSSGPLSDYQIKEVLKDSPPSGRNGLSCQWGPSFLALYAHNKENTNHLKGFGEQLMAGNVAPFVAKEVGHAFPPDKMLWSSAGSFCFLDTERLSPNIRNDIDEYASTKAAKLAVKSDSVEEIKKPIKDNVISRVCRDLFKPKLGK